MVRSFSISLSLFIGSALLLSSGILTAAALLEDEPDDAPSSSASAPSSNNCGLEYQNGTLSQYAVYQSAKYPEMDPNYKYGLMSMPPASEVCAARMTRWEFVKGATLPVYETDDTQVSPEKVKRVVIVIPAKGRDSWNYMNWMRNSRNHAAANFEEVKIEEIAVLSPQFFQQQDFQAGGAEATDVRWPDNNSWSDGSPARYPKNTKAVGMSTFEILDNLALDALKRYPKASHLVFSGHSMGSQFLMRYFVLGRELKTTATISYFAGNPGSYLYLNENRPVEVSGGLNCTAENVNAYKYGLGGELPAYTRIPAEGVSGFMEIAAQRTLNLVLGDKDYGPGDTRCQALAQGKNHKQRGRLWKENIEANYGSYPSAWTYDLAPTCKHDDRCIFNSDAGLQHLFRDGLSPPTTSKREDSGHKMSKRSSKRAH